MSSTKKRSTHKIDLKTTVKHLRDSKLCSNWKDAYLTVLATTGKPFGASTKAQEAVHEAFDRINPLTVDHYFHDKN